MTRRAAASLAAVLLGGCADARVEDEPAHVEVALDTATALQTDAFAALGRSTVAAWSWVEDRERGTAKHVSARREASLPLESGGRVIAMNAVESTLETLTTHKALFRMRDPRLELGALRTEADDIGMRHARFQQLTHGVPVEGAEVSAHFDRAGNLTSVDATYVPDLAGIDVNPTLGEASARAIAARDVVAITRASLASLEIEAGDLVVHVPHGGGEARLAWKHSVRAMAAASPAIWVVSVDAKTGDVIHRYDNLQTIQGRGVGVLGDEKTLEIVANGSAFTMTDASNVVEIRTLTAAGQKTKGTPVTSSDPNAWDTAGPGAGSAVDAHVNARAVYEYYRVIHGRNAINGTGGALVSTVHYGASYDNAAWDGTGMLYGDGGAVFRPPSVSLDVVGHEFTHGVTERTSALAYENQPGALNEAVSDIFGAFIEHAFVPDETRNWSMGESILKAGGSLRDLKDPGSSSVPQPAHMSQFVNTRQDNGGVHANSGIVGNAAFLMTVGGVNPVSKIEVPAGIGWEKSEKLWYRANTKYFLRMTDFAQAAHAVLEAARDIELTAAETKIVEQAFLATGILDATEPTSELADDSASPKRRAIAVPPGSGCSASGSAAEARGGATALLLAAAGLFVGRRRRDRTS